MLELETRLKKSKTQIEMKNSKEKEMVDAHESSITCIQTIGCCRPALHFLEIQATQAFFHPLATESSGEQSIPVNCIRRRSSEASLFANGQFSLAFRSQWNILKECDTKHARISSGSSVGAVNPPLRSVAAYLRKLPSHHGERVE